MDLRILAPQNLLDRGDGLGRRTALIGGGVVAQAGLFRGAADLVAGRLTRLLAVGPIVDQDGDAVRDEGADVLDPDLA